jgi:hypothetical protein
MSQRTVSDHLAEIWVRVVEPYTHDLSREAGRGLMQLQFTEFDRARMNELGAKAHASELTPDERLEMEAYVIVAGLLEPIHQKGRNCVRKPKPDGQSERRPKTS